MGHGGLHYARRLGQITEVGGDDERLPTFRQDHLEGFLGSFLELVHQHHPSAFAGKQNGHGATGPEARSARPGAGDHGDLTLEFA